MIKLPAYLTGFSSRSDGSAGIRLATQELTEQDFGNLKRSLNQFGWFLFSENPINEADIPTENAEDKDKTPSKRLRAVLFILYKQKSRTEDFETFYRITMSDIIELWKTKIDTD